MRRPLIGTAAGVGLIVVLLLMALPMTAASAATATKLANGDEAWFLAKKEPLASGPEGTPDPTCELPTGCNVSGGAVRPNLDAEGTLVVGANNGDQDAQTFFNFALDELPFGSMITGGTVTMPVAQDSDARNIRPETAKMVACLVTGFIPGGADAGSYNDRPAFDKDGCVPVKQVEDAKIVTFSVDLERFGKLWGTGTPMNGITIMVDPEVSAPNPQETWRVAFNSRRRSDQKSEQDPEGSYPKITSTLQYRVEKLPDFGGPVGGGEIDTNTGGGGGSTGPFPANDTGTDTGGFTGDTGTPVASGDTGGTVGSSGTVAPGDSAPPAAPADAGPAEPPLTATPQDEAPQAAGPAIVPAAAPGPSAAVYILPILALLLAGILAWSFIQPVQLNGDREGAVSRLMRNRRLSAANPS